MNRTNECLISERNKAGNIFIFLLHVHDHIIKNRNYPIRERIRSAEYIWYIISRIGTKVEKETMLNDLIRATL